MDISKACVHLDCSEKKRKHVKKCRWSPSCFSFASLNNVLIPSLPKRLLRPNSKFNIWKDWHVSSSHLHCWLTMAPYKCNSSKLPKILTSYKNTVSARKQRLIQSNLLHHHGIRAELSQRTFDFSTHDHHNQASRILTEVLSTGFKWNEFLFLWFLSWKINLYIFIKYGSDQVTVSVRLRLYFWSNAEGLSIEIVSRGLPFRTNQSFQDQQIFLGPTNLFWTNKAFRTNKAFQDQQIRAKI